MGQSYRIRTELGVNKTLNVQLEQDFEFLEILSLTIQQTDVYTRACADYGVVVGRVTANNGLGLPNARVSVFIPIQQVDESNPVITSIYPYKSPNDKNEDGYRYNLLPYEASYTGHAASGTLPTRTDALTGATAVEIYDKYYKFTSKTNDSGDYMIMGVPTGTQQLVMDVDLSDIGEFSLTPQDLIRVGRATEGQVAGNRFRTSTDLNSLPQIVNLTKSLEVSPLWGDPDVCQIAINRVDFDLRDDANIDIQPTAVFMGSLTSTADQMRVRRNAKPRDNMGNLCQLTTGPGQILALRQTIQQDQDGNPILEQYELEQAGNVIDGNGVWLTELPMNLDYIITNEFGERVISNDPTVGIPTKGRYRFKIKWQQPPTLTEQTRRPYFLIPNVKEYGWNIPSQDPNIATTANQIQKDKLNSSYYFGLDWSGYTQGFTGQEEIDRLTEIINCEDTFYEFIFNKVYTVSSFIDEFKNGAKGRFVGIKEIDSQECESTVNKFPVNDGFRNFDFLYFLFALIIQIVQLVGVPLLIVFHFIAFLWNNFAVPFLILIIAYFFRQSIINFAIAALSFPSVGQIPQFIINGVVNLIIAIVLITQFRKITRYRFGKIKIPMIQYPDCQACECEPEETAEGGGVNATSALSQLSNSGLYYTKINEVTKANRFEDVENDDGLPTEEDAAVLATVFSQAVAGRVDNKDTNNYKTLKSDTLRLPNSGSSGRQVFAYSGVKIGSRPDYSPLPFGERINIFNQRKKYFDGINKISVSFNYSGNQGKNHFDNTITILTVQKFETGSLYTFVDPLSSQDVNFTYTAQTGNNFITGISGTPKYVGSTTINVTYCNPSNQTQALSLQYFLNTGTTVSDYKFPMDVEYYQVLTAITVSEAAKIWNISNDNTFAGLLSGCTETIYNVRKNFPGSWAQESRGPTFCLANTFEDFSNQYITILQRGVDPYSPKFNNKYGIGKIFGLANENDLVITASTRLNIPIQPISSGLSVQNHRIQNNIFYPSYFWEATNSFSSFTTSIVGYYSAFDANNSTSGDDTKIFDSLTGVVSKTSNQSYYSLQSSKYYDLSEDLSGVGIIYTDLNKGKKPKQVEMTSYFPSLYGSFTASPLSITSKVNNVMRTDRLPNSDYLDGSGWGTNTRDGQSAAALQQNLGFATYFLNTDTDDFTSTPYDTGADIVSPDIEGQLYESEVLTSLNTCSNMVGLGCYSGFGSTFGINVVCKQTDPIQNGCYVMMVRPLLDLGKDLKTWSEWGFRFRFFYGLCRGVLSQSFTNNWINGTLFAFPIQVDTFYDKQNKPKPPIFAKELVYFDSKTNNFYYRSSPWQGDVNSGQFIGRPLTGQPRPLPFPQTPVVLREPVNKRNLLFPTTIINLGYKDSFYQEIIFDPSARAYIMKSLNPTSYSDTSDLVNLFVISRITDETFLRRLFAGFNPNNNLNQLFSRPQKRIDGDLAQALSINSEYGVIPFSPEYYAITGQVGQPVVVAGTSANPAIGVFFSSTTEDLQNKDFVSPGIIDFRPTNNINAITYPFELKSQKVPFYQWGLSGATGGIFGSEGNNWKTDIGNGITSYRYQALSRRFTASPAYFNSGYNNVGDIYQRGYIFAVDQNQNYAVYQVQAGTYSTMFMVGAPYQFYFGVIKGESALDKFKTKYSIDE
jgi:hypothetical protein